MRTLRRAFLVIALLADIDRYLERGDVELRRGGATFRIASMWLNDNEFSELTARFVELLQPYLRRRRRRIAHDGFSGPSLSRRRVTRFEGDMTAQVLQSPCALEQMEPIAMMVSR